MIGERLLIGVHLVGRPPRRQVAAPSAGSALSSRYVVHGLELTVSLYATANRPAK